MITKQKNGVELFFDDLSDKEIKETLIQYFNDINYLICFSDIAKRLSDKFGINNDVARIMTKQNLMEQAARRFVSQE